MLKRKKKRNEGKEEKKKSNSFLPRGKKGPRTCVFLLLQFAMVFQRNKVASTQFSCVALLPGNAKGYAGLVRYRERDGGIAEGISPAETLSSGLKGYLSRMLVTHSM